MASDFYFPYHFFISFQTNLKNNDTYLFKTDRHFLTIETFSKDKRGPYERRTTGAAGEIHH
ncbi:MAG: hypothetical protein COX19_11470 [Desulfobacterales bacterium CG23_combo_of_CG06-09_8_20_14_all_51_8]|nr:MAG: hypothetical protein COX19_11470 [Desulfobacterales bacterium CG23_combo_of_CG06-09_8_20_14_all_51_8]